MSAPRQYRRLEPYAFGVTMTETAPASLSEENIFVFLDITIGEVKAGRVIIELFKNVVPKTAENFRALCTGEKGTSKTGTRLHFKGTDFHRVVPQFLVQGGDIGASESIYGGPFEDENFSVTHDCEGLVGMANSGPNSNSSQFYVTLVPCSHLDGTNVVFGRIRKGFNIFTEFTEIPRSEEVPTIPCVIADCGEVGREDMNVNESDETEDVYPPWPDDYEQPGNCRMVRVLETIKDSGNYFFARKNYADSERKYRKVLRYVKWALCCEQNHQHDLDRINRLKGQTLINLAAVQLKAGRYKDVVELCTQVIQIDDSNSKAYFRRGQARVKLHEYDKALRDLERAHNLVPDDRIVRKEYASAKRQKLESLGKERQICAKMLFS